MDKYTEKPVEGQENTIPQENETMNEETGDMTELQDETANPAENVDETDNMSEDKNSSEPSWEEKYISLNDSHLRLIAEFDNFRKRTIREKADLIKSGGASVLTGVLPVIDDFERALNMLKTTDNLASATEGVQLIYDKFIGFLSQQGVKVIETVGQPFDTELFEAIATIPAPDESMKGKIIDCVQTGYTLYDKVLRHAKVVVGE